MIHRTPQSGIEPVKMITAKFPMITKIAAIPTKNRTNK